jgi:hypothetical protein
MRNGGRRMIEQWVKDINESLIPKTCIIEGKEWLRVPEPLSQDILYFLPFHDTTDYKIGEFYKIELIDGQYYGTYGISNFWNWYRLDDKNNRIKKESGYGNFYLPIKKEQE